MLQLTRRRPHWHMLVFHYLFGFALSWQLAEDAIMGQGGVHSGALFPWRQEASWLTPLGPNGYWMLFGVEVLLLGLYFCRVQLRWTTLLLAAVMFVDNLGSFLNHRTLMILQLVALSVYPLAPDARATGYRGKARYVSLDLMRWLIFVVYVTTALHKCNPQFLSGETMANIFWMVQEHGMHTYPAWLQPILANPQVCLALGIASIVLEFALPVGLQFRRVAGWFLATAMLFHLGISLLMPFIWIFSTVIFATLIAFLPDRLPETRGFMLWRRDAAAGPRRWLRFVWPGYVTTREDASLERAWCLEAPDGERLSGTAAWIELLALSPLTMLFAEMLRAITFQPERSYAEPESREDVATEPEMPAGSPVAIPVRVRSS